MTMRTAWRTSMTLLIGNYILYAVHSEHRVFVILLVIATVASVLMKE